MFLAWVKIYSRQEHQRKVSARAQKHLNLSWVKNWQMRGLSTPIIYNYNYIDTVKTTIPQLYRYSKNSVTNKKLKRKTFGERLKLRNFVNLWVVEGRVPYLDSVTCDVFQIYFYDNLFNPDQNSKIQNKTLLNELFVLNDQEQNEATINKYTDKRNIVTE